jgi:hypothetical protein
MKDMNKGQNIELFAVFFCRIFGFNFAALAAAVLYSFRVAHITYIGTSGQLLLLYVLIATLLSTACFIIAPRFAHFVRRRWEIKLEQPAP